MMTANETGIGLGRDTSMCGDPKTWFPMRVTYSREMKVKAELDRLEIENFVPMTYKLVCADNGNPHRELVPAINNLIFVRSTQGRISELKTTNEGHNGAWHFCAVSDIFNDSLGAVIGGAIAVVVMSHKDTELQIFGEKFGGKGK